MTDDRVPRARGDVRARRAARAARRRRRRRCCRLANVTLAIDAVRAGAADAALVPLENSVEGAVPATLDELANGEPLVIAEETYLSVAFELMARPGTSLADVGTVATHPHAEAQVRRWLIDEPAARAQVALVGSTAGAAQAVAARRVRRRGRRRGGRRALRAAHVLAHDIADTDGAVTRFVLLTRPAPPGTADRQRPHDAGRVPARGPLRRAAGDPLRVRHPRRQPDPHRVAPDQGPHRPVLLLDRLRGAHRRRAGRRRAGRAAPGVRRRPLPRLVPAARRRAGGRPARAGTTPTSPTRGSGWPGCARRGRRERRAGPAGAAAGRRRAGHAGRLPRLPPGDAGVEVLGAAGRAAGPPVRAAVRAVAARSRPSSRRRRARLVRPRRWPAASAAVLHRGRSQP